MIRISNIDDLKHYIGAARELHETTGRKNFSEERFIESWTRIIAAGIGFIMGRFVNDECREAVGVIIFPDSNETITVATTNFWYVNGSVNGLADGILFTQLIEELIRRDVSSLFFNIRHNYRADKAVHFLQKSGFKAVETVHRKDL